MNHEYTPHDSIPVNHDISHAIRDTDQAKHDTKEAKDDQQSPDNHQHLHVIPDCSPINQSEPIITL